MHIKHWKVYLLFSILVVAFLLILIGCWNFWKNDKSYYLEGTFVCGTRYLSVMEDGSYCDYTPGEVLEEGTFSRVSSGVFLFTPSDASVQPWQALAFRDGTLYRCVDNAFWIYDLQARTPFFINVTPSDWLQEPSSEQLIPSPAS